MGIGIGIRYMGARRVMDGGRMEGDGGWSVGFMEGLWRVDL